MKITNENSTVSYQKMVENVLPGMVNVGIPLNEGRVFIALILEPDISAYRLCEITGIPDSRIYGILENALKLNMIEVQFGVPKTYRATAPEPMIEQVKSKLKNRYETEIRISESLEDQLQEIWLKKNEQTSIESGIEVAYVVKGATNIVSKMKEMVHSANSEIMAILPDFTKFSSIREQLLEAKLRGADIKIALPDESLKKISDDSSRNFNISVLSPQCSETWLLLADGRLLTVSGKGIDNQVSGILTRDKVLVQMSKAYFENPSCCFSL